MVHTPSSVTDSSWVDGPHAASVTDSSWVDGPHAASVTDSSWVDGPHAASVADSSWVDGPHAASVTDSSWVDGPHAASVVDSSWVDGPHTLICNGLLLVANVRQSMLAAGRKCSSRVHSFGIMMCTQLLLTALLWMKLYITVSGVLFNATYNQSLSNSVTATDPEVGRLLSLKFLRSRRKRYISSWDISTLLDYHNRVRSQVFPPAANMEYMVWDDQLAKSAEWWALQCVWDHGPPHTMPYVGQNLSIYTGRYRSVIDLVKSWHDEKNSFSYPNTCSRPVCSHYTQMVWAASNKMGCAVNRCPSINVNGASWKQAVFLVCNYSIKGNWVGEPPYRTGRPCSACPSSYGDSCSRNLCSSTSRSNKIY
ncbi:hypothetical protein JZ751_005489 [Albula glossodonta]|uniref:SCP domain-containing protein n=1 Tax=Albula glossodonta TaxID=121402 RepID=A0A8T2N4T5_9TELE|nr:hypothetical protein JZ751_005489 [Albula glossodonta]